MNLNPEQARKKLVEALRSGDYDQTKGNLRVGDGYCCLGVACDLYRKIEDPSMQWKMEWNPVVCADVWQFMGAPGLLPSEVQNWLGFSTSDGASVCGPYSDLSYLNDQGESFEYIADFIERGRVKLIG